MGSITIHELTRSYGKRRGVEGISLTVPDGSLFGFLGPNGAGKTTTIRVLLGFLRPTRGRASIFNLDCWRDSHRIKHDVGYLPGDLRLYPWLNGEQALAMFGAIRGRGRGRGGDMLRHGRELAESFALDLSVRVRAMSRGMRQKLGLILALAHKPRLLMLDEPSSSLDPLMQQRLHAHLRSLAAAGHTIFFSSHTLSEVEQLCDRVAIVRDGRLVANETLEKLRQQAGHQVTIRWRDAETVAKIDPPVFLELDRRDAGLWEGVLIGPVAPLIQWLALIHVAGAVEDLMIGPPDLESVFRRFYS